MPVNFFPLLLSIALTICILVWVWNGVFRPSECTGKRGVVVAILLSIGAVGLMFFAWVGMEVLASHRF